MHLVPGVSGGTPEVGVPGLGNGYHGFPEPEPGRPPIIDVPGGPISVCSGESAPRARVGSGPGQNAGRIEYDQPNTGTLSCGPFGAGKAEGELTTMGYDEAELINAF